MFFPSLSFACELAIGRWRIEVVEAQVGDLVSPIHRHIEVVFIVISNFVLKEISFLVQ